MSGHRRRLLRRAVRAADGAVQWLSVAMERRSHAERFFVGDRTPNTIIHSDGLMSLRYYPPLQGRAISLEQRQQAVADIEHAVPLLLVPPLAASTMIFDLLPQRSLVQYLRARGFRVYLIDWGDPDDTHAHLGLRHYTTEMLPAAVAALRRHAGTQELSLLGYCMGGLFALIHAGWAQDPAIRNIVTIASPVDYHRMGAAGEVLRRLQAPARLVRRHTPWRIDRIDPKYLRVPGALTALAFKLTNPVGTLAAYVDLLMNLADRDYVVAHDTTATWFNRMHDYPGGIVQDFLVRVGIDNALARGRLALGADREARLRGIDASLLAIAGDSDRIVPLTAARRVLDVVTDRDRSFRILPGGHAGVFAGARAPDTTWRIAADWLAMRSAETRAEAVT